MKLKIAFDEYIKESYFGKVINRLDLHEITFEAGWDAAQLSFDEIENELELKDKWVKHHQESAQLSFNKSSSLEAEIKELRKNLAWAENISEKLKVAKDGLASINEATALFEDSDRALQVISQMCRHLMKQINEVV